jgi:hypothetical protein
MIRLFYKMLMRSCVFNDIKRDKKALFCVTVLDICKSSGLPISRLAAYLFPRLMPMTHA